MLRANVSRWMEGSSPRESSGRLWAELQVDSPLLRSSEASRTDQPMLNKLRIDRKGHRYSEPSFLLVRVAAGSECAFCDKLRIYARTLYFLHWPMFQKIIGHCVNERQRTTANVNDRQRTSTIDSETRANGNE